MAKIVFTTDGLDGSPLILNEDHCHWLPPSCLLTQPEFMSDRRGAGKTVVPHELTREEYDRVRVVVQATDKACAAGGAS
jgi:hypothetical protein